MENFNKESFVECLDKEHCFLVEVFDIIGSTNDYLIERARQGDKEGTIIVATSQTKGKGRMGRKFHSPDGGVYFSVLLRPDKGNPAVSYLTAATALCLKQSIEEVYGVKTGVKWVNDVYLDGRKCAGILTESALDYERGGYSYVVVGIGVNLFAPEEGYPKEIEDIATAINVSVDNGAERLVATTINKLFDWYNNFDKVRFITEYRSSLMLIGKRVRVLQAGADKGIATVLGIDDECHLEVQYENGAKETLFYGEVSLCLRP